MFKKLSNKTKKCLLVVLSIVCTMSVLNAELDFCDKSVLVVIKPQYSSFTGSLDDTYFGTFEKESIQNIFQIHNIDEMMVSERGTTGETLGS